MKKNSLKIALVFMGVIILILLLLPGFVKRYTINHSKELLGRQIHINKLNYNYFTSTVEIYDFKMLEQNEQDNFITFDTLIINLEPLQLFKDKIEIEQFYIQGLEVNVLMKDSIFNFNDLIEFHSTENDTLNQNSSEEDEFKYALSNLELKDANLFFDNRNVDRITHIQDLSFLIPFIGWNQEEKSNADVKFNFEQGGYFESKLNINPVDGEFDATITISDLHLEPFYKYVVDYANINSLKGSLNSQILIEGNTNKAINSIVSGVIEVHDFEMTDTNNKIFFEAKKVNAVLKKIDYANNSYIIDSLRINKSYTFFQLDSVTNNFFKIFKLDSETAVSELKSAPAKTADTTHIDEAQSDLYYAINHLEVNEGVIDYTDNLTGRPFNYHLSAIKIASDSILSNSNWVNIHSDMLLNNRGTLNAQLGYNPISLNDVDLDIVIENFLLSDLNIYTKHYTGHNIIKGDMYYYSNSKITNGTIVSENKLLVKNVSLNNTKGGLYSLPLKFALFLLKDKNGDVNLDIPVRGDLNDPSVNVRKIVWNTFKNLIVKAATSPGRLLANLVGGDPKDIEKLTFNYLDTIPTEKHLKQLNKLLELEQKKEGLKIEMVYYADKQLQKEALAKDAAGKIYFSATKKDYLKNEKDFEAFILGRTASDSLNIKQSYIAITNKNLIDSIAQRNSKLLISNIENYIKTVQGSTQIKIIISDPKAPENIGAIPTLKVNFSLKENE